MYDSVIESFPKLTAPLEGCILWPYQDILGLVTIGYGCLIDPAALASTVQDWMLEGTSDLPTPPQVAHEWGKVKAMQKALHFARYKDSCRLRLSMGGVNALLQARMQSFEGTLRHYFPEWDTFPADAQLAIMAMAWACGAGFPKTFVNFTRFALKRDWANAAKCAKIREDGNPGVHPRNLQVQLCLANAAAIDDLSGLPTPALYWPNPVRDAVAPDSDPANIPLHVLAAEAIGSFNVYDSGLTGHAHSAEAA
jgi:GH24 family phage-related lysozyme (muramidase)